MATSSKLLLVLFFGLGIAGCSNPALRYAKAKYPHCSVVQMDENAQQIRVTVTCPNRDPFEKTFTKR